MDNIKSENTYREKRLKLRRSFTGKNYIVDDASHSLPD